MIRLPAPQEELSPQEWFGLRTLVDCSRLLPVSDPHADVVQLEIVSDHDEPVRLGGSEPPFQLSDGKVVLRAALLREVARISTAEREQLSEARDRYGRVPASQNQLVLAESEDEPLVSRTAGALRRAVAGVADRRPVVCLAPWPEGKRWAAAFTHDVDVLALWQLFTLRRLGELAARRETKRALAVLRAALRFGNPVLEGLKGILDLEANFGIRSTWFVIAGRWSLTKLIRGDVTYRRESARVRRIVRLVRSAGHEIALHGSFGTMLNGVLLREEHRALEAIAGGAVTGVRQHFLRVRPGVTQRCMADAGLTYDSSMGFSDRNGFRLGVCDVVPAWDREAGAELGLDEVPLIWMDRALSKYARVEDPRAWCENGTELARKCHECEGLWVGLWHPNLTAALGFPGAPESLEWMVGQIMDRDPYCATLSELIAWRRARRSVEAVTVAPDGRMELVAGRQYSGELVLENGAGEQLRADAWPSSEGSS